MFVNTWKLAEPVQGHVLAPGGWIWSQPGTFAPAEVWGWDDVQRVVGECSKVREGAFLGGGGTGGGLGLGRGGMGCRGTGQILTTNPGPIRLTWTARICISEFAGTDQVAP